MGFEGKVVVVTGATSGIGEATANMFLEKGASVAAIGRNEKKGEALSGRGMHFYPCDVRDPDAVQKTTRQILEDFGGVDVLVNCAGVNPEGTVETLSLEEWREVFAVNVDAAFLMCKYLIPGMRRKGGGRIINIGSTAGTVGAPDLQVYSASKGAVIQLSRSMAAAYSAEKILVNCVCPGGTRTPMMLDLGEKACHDFAQLFPIRRLGEPDEIASVIVFLASDEASFVTGSVVLVDGGFTCI